GQATTGQDFVLDPLHLFSGTISMVSAPYGYTTAVGTLLGVPAADVTNGKFLFYAWDGTKYIGDPNAPADTFHLGRGYFMAYTTNLGLTTLGTALDTNVPPDTPYKIPLVQGWNIIGDPYPFSLDFLNAAIEDANGNQVDIQTAQGGLDPLIGGALWTFQNG